MALLKRKSQQKPVESAEELVEDEEEQPIVAELDELQTYIGRKTDRIWLWTAINHHAPGILAMEIGDRSSQTFAKLWQRAVLTLPLSKQK